MAKKTMGTMKVPLTDAQLRKLAKGMGVRVCPNSQATAYDFYCNPSKCKKAMRQMTKGKGFTMKLDPEEMDANEVEIEGGRINFKKIGRTLRSTAKSVGKFYRDEIRPVVGPKIRKAVKEAIEKGIPIAAQALGTITGQPGLVAAAQPAIQRAAKKVAEKGTEKLSKLTGAFGVKQMKGCGTKKKAAPKKKKTAPKKEDSVDLYAIDHTDREPPAYRPQLQDNYSNFLNPNHPAMNPVLPPADNSLPQVPRHGTKGSGLYGSGLYAQGNGLYVAERGGSVDFRRGSAMNPLLPQVDNSTYYL